MTDYNDGCWHGWNGGECPVHPESLVLTAHVATGDLKVLDTAREADNQYWPNVRAFRVVRAHREPRRLWVNEYPNGAFYGYDSRDKADRRADSDRIRCIEFVEVLP